MTLGPYRFNTIEARHAISSRHGGVSLPPYDSLNLGYATADDEKNVAANRREFLASVGVGPNHVITARLSHGNRVAVFRRSDPHGLPVMHLPVRPSSDRRERFFAADAVVSDVPGLHFLLTFADCVPLVFHDPITHVVGAAHAGWRGTAAHIAREVVQTMTDAFGSNPADIRVGIGPSIGPCCYAVGQEVLKAFAENGSEPILAAGGSNVDLWATNQRQLEEAGVGHIELAKICAACRRDTYFSHRAERGRTGRFALLAGLD